VASPLQLSDHAKQLMATTTSLLKKSKHWEPTADIVLQEKSFWFVLKFFTYDIYTSHGEDYIIAPAFEKIYSTTESILIMFPNQVLLSQRRPKTERRIDHLKEIGTQYEFPDGTFAYTTVDEQTYLFSKPVSIESFWLRLH
jgi:hypothetical protein